MQMTERHVEAVESGIAALRDAANRTDTPPIYKTDEQRAMYRMARASIINGEAARLGEVAEHLRAQGSEVERLRAAANAAFDLLGGIDGAAEARDLLLAGLMPAPPLAATSEEG